MTIELEKRTKTFALRIIRLAGDLPQNRVGDVIGRQVLKSGTSVGANYVEARRASSTRHFVSLLEIATREAAETLYWLDLLIEGEIIAQNKLHPLRQECSELVAILTTSARTAKRRRE